MTKSTRAADSVGRFDIQHRPIEVSFESSFEVEDWLQKYERSIITFKSINFKSTDLVQLVRLSLIQFFGRSS